MPFYKYIFRIKLMLKSFNDNVRKCLNYNYIEICLALLRFMKVGFISNKVNRYKIKNLKYLDILNVIKIDIINHKKYYKKKKKFH